MSTLAEHAEDYLQLRRALGFKLTGYDDPLSSFVAYVGAAGTGTVTAELAVSWAWLSPGIKPITASFRISWVRGFARYLHAIDPAHEVPPRGLLAVPRRRPAPYLYSPSTCCGCWPRRGGSARRCTQQPTRRCSGCLPPPACESVKLPR